MQGRCEFCLHNAEIRPVRVTFAERWGQHRVVDIDLCGGCSAKVMYIADVIGVQLELFPVDALPPIGRIADPPKRRRTPRK